jgi:O-antigen/teichoic acid export membrane protein
MLLFGTMFRMVISFVFVIYAADELGVEGFGIYSIGIHYFELFISLASTAIGILLTREIAKFLDDEKAVNRTITAAFTFCLLLAIGGMGCMILLAFLFGFSAVTTKVILLASVALIPAAISAVAEAIFVAYERAEFVALAVSVESVIRVVLCIAAIAAGYGLVTLFLILIATRILQLLVFVISMKRTLPVRLEFSNMELGSFVKSWRVFAVENWMATLYTNLDVLVLSWLAGEVAVGLYSAAWKVVRLGSVAAKAYTTAVFPLLARMYEQARSEFEKTSLDTIRLMMVLSLPAVVTISIFSDRVIGLIFRSGEYVDSAPILTVLIWVLLLEFLNPFLSHTLFARGRQNRSAQVAGISLAVNLVMTFALVYQFGAWGAAVGTVVAGLVATIAYLCFALNEKEIFNTLSSVLRTLVASAAVGALLFALKDFHLAALVGLGIISYSVLAVAMRLVCFDDWNLVRSIVFAAKPKASH